MRTKVILYLIGFCLVDIVIPIPILGLVLLHAVLTRSPWFFKLVQDVYHET